MGIENIPEMQVRESEFDGSRKVNPQTLQGFEGKFLVVKGTNDKNYILAQRDSSHQMIFTTFMQTAFGEYHCSVNEKFSPLGGGCITIDSKKVLLDEKSTDYGKYDQQIVLPIS